jgi:dihydrofolate reductase
MIVSLIAAVAENGVIGRGGELPWRLSADLQRFKSLTMGHPIIMGRRTWESIKRPLPGRTMIVVSRQPNYLAEGCHVFPTLEAAIARASSMQPPHPVEKTFVIGGGDLYRAALPSADKIYLTRVHATIAGDATFPDVDWSEWDRTISHRHSADASNEYDYTFEVWIRYKNPGAAYAR